MKTKVFKRFVALSETLGLNKNDVCIATEFLEHEEFGLAFDIVVSQIYEYDISIDSSFYKLTEEVAGSIKIPQQEYLHLKQLIKEE